MEADKWEEETRPLPFKPVILPPLTLTMKKTWKANREKLESAGIFEFLCWAQSITRVAYVDTVLQFVQTYSPATQTAQVCGRTIDFSVKAVGRHLRLPTEGLTLEDLPGLTKKQHEDMFEGDFPRTPKGCQLEKAKHHWRAWFKFVNNYLVFKPQKEMMTQRIVVAAMNTWNGKKVNWGSIVQQKAEEEIRRYQKEKLVTGELFSAFYISVVGQELPAPARIITTPSSSTQTPSPLASPMSKSEENSRLQLQVERYEELLQEKRTQLIEKSEALVSCQSTKVKHLLELAEAVKEKMDNQIILDEHKKTIDWQQKQVADKEAENEALRQQVQKLLSVTELTEKYRTEVDRVKMENEGLKEKLAVQEAEAAKYRVMTKQKQVMAEGQISETTNAANLITPSVVPFEIVAGLWDWESRGPEPKGLFQIYEKQCQLFLLMSGLKRYTWIDHSRF